MHAVANVMREVKEGRTCAVGEGSATSAGGRAGAGSAPASGADGAGVEAAGVGSGGGASGCCAASAVPCGRVSGGSTT